jgi:hypothetical protein
MVNVTVVNLKLCTAPATVRGAVDLVRTLQEVWLVADCAPRDAPADWLTARV